MLRNLSVSSLCLALISTLAVEGTSLAAEARRATETAASPLPRHGVQAIPLPTHRGDDQASWIIEPNIARIPSIAGLDPQLPPHVHRRLSYAFDLAQRGATYSANTEFRAVLSLCALELDAREGGTSRREALHEAWRALDEADEFNGERIDLWDVSEVRNVAAGHETPVLKTSASHASDAIQVVQAYYAFAEQRFTDAGRGMPGASLAFYGLGRTFVVPGTQVTQAAGKAALLQRVALAIAPQNVLAANELGVLFAEHGQLDQAERLFRHCLAANPTPETWRNLAVVLARKGDRAASQSAVAAADELAASMPGAAGPARHAPPAAADAPDSTVAQKQGFWTKFSFSNLRSVFRR